MDKTDEYYRFPKIMEDEVFEAEIVSDSSDKTLNITLAATFAFCLDSNKKKYHVGDKA